MNAVKKLGISSLLVIILFGSVRCGASEVPPVVKCVGGAIITLVLAFGAEVDAPVLIPISLGVASECIDAASQIIGIFQTPSEPGEQVEIHKSTTKVTSLKSESPFKIANCNGSQSIKGNFAIEEVFPVFLQLGTDKLTSPPAEDDLDSTAFMERALIDQLHISLGSKIQGIAHFYLDIPPGSQAEVETTNDLSFAIGTVDIKQDGKVIVPEVAWRYPISIQPDDSQTQITIHAC